MLLKRHLYYTVRKYISHKNALLITGGRQVGKTSLLKLIAQELPEEQTLWFDFDNPLDQKHFEDIDYNDIYTRFVQRGVDPKKQLYVFIDEIQHFPEISRVVKYLIDHYQIKFFLTGSASYYIQNLFPESLAGRKFDFHLSPLNFEEFLYFKGFIKKIDKEKVSNFASQDIVSYEQYDQEYREYMRFGGYPEVVLESDYETKQRILSTIFISYFEKDIIKFGNYTESKEMRDLISLLARRVGTILDVQKISAELGITRSTVYSYLHFLEKTFFIHLVGRYASIDRQIAGGKKVYFSDSGMVNHITQISEGQLFENTVYNQLRAHADNPDSELTYYQTQKGKEIDFVMRNDYAFEIKRRATSHHERDLKKRAEKLGIPAYYLVSQEYAENVLHVVYPQML